MDSEARNLFILGLGILFGWMVIILICASPQLFRDLIKRNCSTSSARKQQEEKIRKAEARVIATRALAEKPNLFLFGQVLAMSSLASTKTSQVDSASLKLCMPEQDDDQQQNEAGPSSV